MVREAALPLVPTHGGPVIVVVPAARVRVVRLDIVPVALGVDRQVILPPVVSAAAVFHLDGELVGTLDDHWKSMGVFESV